MVVSMNLPELKKKGAPLTYAAYFFYCVLLLLYGSAARPAIIWIFGELGVDSLFNIIPILSVFLGVLIWRFGPPQKYLPVTSLGLIVACALGVRWSHALLPQLSASFALLGLYGFFAAHKNMSRPLWRAGVIMAAVTALALPFALVPSTGMGFYLRLMTADAAAQILAIAGHSSLAAHDVLIFDTGIAQVDLPCSGLKSLFVGTGFYCIASLILRRALSLRWVIGYVIFASLLIIVNTLRVTTLIWVSEIFEQRALAETIHMPLGVMLFSLGCLCGVFILFKIPGHKTQETPSLQQAGLTAIKMSAFILTGTLLWTFTVLFPVNKLDSKAQIDPPTWIQVRTLDLTAAETRFFGGKPRTSAGKWTFDYEDLSGSMLVVHSGAVNGLHAPEVCLLGNGISVDDMQTITLGRKSHRWLTVDQERRNAVYWMQNRDVVTDDFRTRLKEYVFGKQDDWIMVTILLDQRLNLSANTKEITDNNKSLQALMGDLQQHYAFKLRKGKTPHDNQ